MKKHLANIFMIHLLLLIIISTTFCSQPNKKESKINVIDVASSVGNGRITDISEVAGDIRYIALETKDSSLIDNGARVQFQNNRLFVTDRSGSLKIFDRNGNFLRKFNRIGRGPQEYLYPSIFFITPQSGNILVSTSITRRCVFKYDSNGNFIGKFATPENQNFSIDDPLWLDDNSYIATLHVYADKPENSAVIYDSTGKIKFKLPIPKLAQYKIFEELGPMALVNPDGKITYEKSNSQVKELLNPDVPFLSRYKDNIRIVYDSNDTVLSIKANLQVDTPYIFNYGKYRDNSMDRTSITHDKGKHISLLPRNQFMETEGFLLMRFNLRDYATEPYEKTFSRKGRLIALKDAYSVYNKKSGEFWFLNQTEKGVLGFRDNLMGGPPFWPTDISFDNSMVTIISAFDLIEYAKTHKVSPKLAEIVSKLKDTDNPVIVIAK